jgi:hypothetical protein
VVAVKLTKDATPEEIRREWVRRLREPDRKQGKRVLHRIATDEQCCLGVLCEVAFEAGVVEREEYDGLEGGPVWQYGKAGHDDVQELSAAILPRSVAEWANVGQRNPVITVAGRNLAASAHNDDGIPFPMIADAIELRWGT